MENVHFEPSVLSLYLTRSYLACNSIYIFATIYVNIKFNITNIYVIYELLCYACNGALISSGDVNIDTAWKCNCATDYVNYAIYFIGKLTTINGYLNGIFDNYICVALINDTRNKTCLAHDDVNVQVVYCCGIADCANDARNEVAGSNAVHAAVLQQQCHIYSFVVSLYSLTANTHTYMCFHFLTRFRINSKSN